MGYVRTWTLFCLPLVVFAQSVQYQEVAVTAGPTVLRMATPIAFAALGARQVAPVRIRASADLESWSAWRLLAADAENPAAAALVWFGPGQRWIEVESLSGEAYAMELALIDPGVSPPIKNALRATEGTGPRVVSRIEWGCPDGDKQRGTPSYAPVTHLIVHHTADGPVADAAAWVRAIWAFHVNTNRWADIGYNYLIGPDGTIFEGRAGGDNVIGAHFSCQNSGTMGVSMLGNFMQRQTTPEAFFSLEQVLRWQAKRIGLNPLGEGLHAGSRLTMPRISSHRDGNSSPTTCTRTDCPGNVLYAQLPLLRWNVAEWETTGLWHKTGRRSFSGPEAFWFGDEETGNYDMAGQVASGALVSPEFELRTDSVLRFVTWHETENPTTDWDQKWVEIRLDGGEWRPLAQLSGIYREWIRQEIRLPFRGKAQIRFRFDSRDASFNQFEGWYLDDVHVTP